MLTRKLFQSLIISYAFISGSVMVVAMKLIYIGFEKKNKALESLDPFSYYGYILNPASIIFGPFITYTDYLQLFHAHSMVSPSFIFPCYFYSYITNRDHGSSLISALMLRGSNLNFFAFITNLE